MRTIDSRTDAAPGFSTTVRGEGLVLRPWDRADAQSLIDLYNTAEMDRWTPIAHPFGPAEADAYLDRALSRRGSDVIQRAITQNGRGPLGEVLLFATDVPGTCELGYAVAAEHRGRSLAARAVRVMLGVAEEMGYDRARLRIVVGNLASEAVARRTGFQLEDREPDVESRKGYTLKIATWTRNLWDAG